MSELIKDLAPVIGIGIEFGLVGIIYGICKIMETIENWRQSRKKFYLPSVSMCLPRTHVQKDESFTYYPIFCNEKTFNKTSKNAITPS